MRFARIRKVAAWAQQPKVQRSFRIAAVAFGATCLKQLLTEQNERLDALEERGLVPLDDMVTLGDMAKIDRRVWVLEGEPGPDPAAYLDDDPDSVLNHQALREYAAAEKDEPANAGGELEEPGAA